MTKTETSQTAISIEANAPYKMDASPVIVLETLADHRAAFFSLRALRMKLLASQHDNSPAIAELIDSLDPQSSVWTEPTPIGGDAKTALVTEALEHCVDNDPGTWFADQAGLMLEEQKVRALPGDRVLVLASAGGGLAVQKSLF